MIDHAEFIHPSANYQPEFVGEEFILSITAFFVSRIRVRCNRDCEIISPIISSERQNVFSANQYRVAASKIVRLILKDQIDRAARANCAELIDRITVQKI